MIAPLDDQKVGVSAHKRDGNRTAMLAAQFFPPKSQYPIAKKREREYIKIYIKIPIFRRCFRERGERKRERERPLFG